MLHLSYSEGKLPLFLLGRVTYLALALALGMSEPYELPARVSRPELSITGFMVFSIIQKIRVSKQRVVLKAEHWWVSGLVFTVRPQSTGVTQC